MAMNPSYGNQVSESRRGRDEAPRPSSSSISARRALTVREQLDRVMATLRHSLRFWKAGAALFLLGLVITAPVAMTRPRVYRSEALLLYKERINPLDRDAGSNTGLRIGMRLRELVLSRSNLERIITEMNLYEKLVDEQGMNPAVDFLRTKINFKAREGATYALSFEGDNAQLAQEVTRRLTDTLLRESQRSTVEVVAGTKEFLDAESQRIDDELKKRESALAKFLQAHPSYAVPVPGTLGAGMANDAQKRGPAPAPTPKRTRSSDPRTEALEREIERIQLRLAPPSAPQPREVPPELKAMAEEWRRREGEAQREVEAAERDVQTARQSYTDEHPDVKRAKGRLEAALRAQARTRQEQQAALQRMVPSAAPPPKPLTDEERKVLEEELGTLQGELGRARQARRETSATPREGAPSSPADDIVRLETEYAQLLRNVSEAQDQRKQLENKRFLAELNERINVGDGGVGLVIIDPPYKPTRPVKGGRTQAAAIGGAASLGLTLALMLVLALLDDRIYAREDMERVESLPLLVTVPVLDKAQQRELAAAQKRARLPAPRGPAAGERREGEVARG